MSRQISRYGWKRQLPDHRDLVFGLEETVYEAPKLPVKFSLRDQFPLPVFDQMQLGSCVSNSAVANITFRASALGKSYPMLSRLFVYYESRRIEGDPLDQDTGLEVRTAFKELGSEGSPPETEWLYTDANPGPFQQQPPAQAYTDAKKFEALVYKSILANSPGAPMRSAIYQKMPISFGFPVPAYFETYNAANDYLRLPGPNDQIIGGHSTLVIGWDFSCQHFPVPVFEVRNSWGDSWGDAGHFFMSHNWFDPWRQLASDLWVITKVE